MYLGAGVHVNEDTANVYARGSYVGGIIPDGSKIVRSTDISYGIHSLVGYGHCFSNRLFLSLEQQIGLARHSAEVKSYLPVKAKVTTKFVKPWEFTTLARLGYGFESFPGVIYLAGGMKILKIDAEGCSKTIVRPVVGVGYQHAISTHWSLRGDVLYTHVSSVNCNMGKTATGEALRVKAKGHRLSAAITLVYTF